MVLTKINNKFFNYYIFICLVISIFFLYHKFQFPTDWTTSEWLINYQGGFTRRGLAGEILIQINSFLNVEIRNLVYIFEIILLSIYYYYIIDFFKKVEFSPLIILIIFSPLGFLFPVTETEAIARKEVLLFCLYLFYLGSILKGNQKLTYLILLIGLPIINFVWDGNIFYIFFFIYTFFLSKIKINKKEVIIFSIFLIPYLISYIILITTKSNDQMIEEMCKAINEPCFGAMNFLDYSFKDQMNYGLSRLKIEYLIRYLFIFVICFSPFLFIFYDQKNKTRIFSGYILCLVPTFIFLYVSFDWGRYLNILYIFSVITLIFLVKIKKIEIEKTRLSIFINELIKDKLKLYFFYIYLFIYLFTWHPKVILTDDIGSLPYLRILDRIFDYLII
tara:strand:- start:584 stop:1753 length:1170 start_codon:yes stop_codon:yes gene_type:complete